MFCHVYRSACAVTRPDLERLSGDDAKAMEDDVGAAVETLAAEKRTEGEGERERGREGERDREIPDLMWTLTECKKVIGVFSRAKVFDFSRIVN